MKFEFLLNDPSFVILYFGNEVPDKKYKLKVRDKQIFY